MNYAVILAGGTGSRAGGPLPKQFQKAASKSIFWYSVEAFLRFDPDCRVILVVHPDFLLNWDDYFGEEEKSIGLKTVRIAGGNSRIQSVRNALEFISQDRLKEKTVEPTSPGNDDLVFIHDAARPLVSTALISRGAAVVGPGTGGVPVTPLSDSIRHLTGEASVAVNRAEYVAVQTPQVFMYDDIKRAYESLEDENGFTDDASVAENVGLRIVTFAGEPSNFKITTPEDLKRLQALL